MTTRRRKVSSPYGHTVPIQGPLIGLARVTLDNLKSVGSTFKTLLGDASQFGMRSKGFGRCATVMHAADVPVKPVKPLRSSNPLVWPNVIASGPTLRAPTASEVCGG
jgi:hypothetical protein